MKQIDKIQKKREWEQFYDPDFDWHKYWRDWELYGYARDAADILTEDFIREFKDKVNWRYICKFQTLSDDFICEFIREIKDNVKNWKLIFK